MTPVTLETPRLVLRPWREADLEPLFAINGDAESMRHFAAVMTRAESDAWARGIQAHFDRHGWGFWVVEGRAAERAVALSDLTNEEALDYARQRLERLGVNRALLRAGAREGDVVRIGRLELEYAED